MSTPRTRLLMMQSAKGIPATISGLTLWLDSLAISGVGDGGTVSLWPDKSSNRYDVSQGVGNNQPTYNINQLNGLPVIRFDGSNDQLTRGSTKPTLLFTLNAATTIFIIMKQTGTQVNNCPLTWRYSDGNIMQGLLSYSDILYFDFGTSLAAGRVSGAQPGGWDNAFHLVELFRHSDGTQTITVDGANVVSATGKTGAITNLDGVISVGAFATGAIPFKGDIQEILVYNRALTDAERMNLRAYFGARTGLTIANGVVISSPVAYTAYQRNGSGQASIPITGVLYGDETYDIQANFNGGAYQTIASGVTRTFSGTLTGQNQGQGMLTVRATCPSGSWENTVNYIGVGDIVIVAGQSNAIGQGTNNQVYTHATLKATKYTNAGVWAECLDPVDTTGHGSVYPLIATSWMANQSVPVAFVPCAVDGSRITDWEGADAAYIAMKARVLVTGAKFVFWWQGEGDAIDGMNQATYNAALDALANQIQTDLGVKIMPCKLQNCSGIADAQELEINDAIGEAWGDNTNVLTGPDLTGLPSDDAYHLKTDAHLASAATLWWTAIQSAFGW